MSIHARRRVTFIVIAIVAVISGLYALMSGSMQLSVNDVIQTLLGNGTGAQNLIIKGIRLPRLLTAMVAGAALAASAIILQIITDNPLAEPGILGINAGASFMIVGWIALSGTAYYEAMSSFTKGMIPFLAFAGALLACGMVWFMARDERGIHAQKMILSGIGVNAAFTAATTFIQLSLSKGDFARALTWTNGSLWGTAMSDFYMLAPVVAIAVMIALFFARNLDVMAIGDENAISLGVDPVKNRIGLMILSVVLAASATAICGNLSFVGLVGAQIAARITGPRARNRIPSAMLISAALLVFADTIGRTAFSPLEIPAGVLVSIPAVPYFLWLALKGDS